jgi:hypothetical protein
VPLGDSNLWDGNCSMHLLQNFFCAFYIFFF